MAQPKAAETEWMSKEDAAQLLGVKERQIEKRVQQGYIEKTFLPRQMHERQARVRYSRADVEALKRGEPNHTPAAEPVSPQSKELAVMPHPAQQKSGFALLETWHAATEHLAKLSAAVPVTKAWLTLREAAAYSGLQVSELAHLVRAEMIYACGRGPKTWRVQRESLDAFGKAAHQ